MAHDFGTPANSGGAQAARMPVGTRAADEVRIPHPRTPRFVFAFHPMRWIRVNGEWLPDLQRKLLDVGVGRVDAHGDDTLMRVSALRAGGTIIEPHTVPPGTPDGTYLAAYRCREGTHHCSAWETPLWSGNVALGYEVDLDGYHNYLRWLVAEGIVPRITEPVRRRLEAKLAKRAAKRAARGDTPAPAPEPEPKPKAPSRARKGAAEGDDA